MVIVALTAVGEISQLEKQICRALEAGVPAPAIGEAIFHTAPYCGFIRAAETLKSITIKFPDAGIDERLELGQTISEVSRYQDGLAVQEEIFGQEAGKISENMPDAQALMTRYLSGICFGDFYTRAGLELSTRELLTLCVIAALGGCEAQIKAHVVGNLTVGNSKDMLLAARLLCTPYYGFPRTLNAISAINASI